MSKPYKGFEPKWYLETPPAKSYRSIFKWGDPNFNKIPKENLYKLMKEIFHLTDDDFKNYDEPLGLEEVKLDKPCALSEKFLNKLRDVAGSDNVSVDDYDRLSVAYGKTVGSFKNHHEVCGAMAKAMSGMGSFLALAFVSSQFIQYFNYTKLGTILALNGANFLDSINIGLIPLMVIFVLFSAFMNLFMGSASAKWNILAPVFVPMFMLLGYSPELCQLAYRIGDSCTNIITPMMSFFAMIVVFVQEYDDEAGMGTLTSMMLPYTIVFLIGWTLMMIVWITLGLPLGPNSTIFLAA